MTDTPLDAHGESRPDTASTAASPGWACPPTTETHSASQAEPGFAQPSPGVDAATLGRTSIGLIAVIAVILLCAWLLRCFNGARGHNPELLKVVASRAVGQRERVVVVEIDDQWLVLGVTPSQVNTLHTLVAQASAQDGRPANNTAPTFGTAFAHNLRQATARWSRSRAR
ncbi:flagellar biosynthetic protein FliO [Salinisphaera sp. T31B1]|uniref:flagellar biosynthetic protein FliO n=1 Tax=Salinisphaera sp. T31B1 TaxID=727963 RepID=UPI003340F6A7